MFITFVCPRYVLTPSRVKPSLLIRLSHIMMLGSVFNRHQASTSEPSRARLRIMKVGKYTCPFSEFRGLGSPGLNIGQPGDIYIDITPGLHALYARYSESWLLWPGSNDVSRLLRHPLYSDRCLWCHTTIGWFHPRHVRVNSGEWHSWRRNFSLCLNIYVLLFSKRL
jgi:hypothetical protein